MREKQILTKYVIKEYLLIFGIIFSVLSSVYTLILFFEILDDALEFRAPISAICTYLFYNQPIVIKKTLPLSFFFSTLTYLALASRSFELVALKALGIRLRRVLIPISFLAFIAVLMLLFWNFFVAPWGEIKTAETRRVRIKKERMAIKMRYTDIWMKQGEITCFIKFYDEKKRAFKDVRCFWVDNGRVYKMAWGPIVLWKGKEWVLNKGSFIEVNRGGIVQQSVSGFIIPLSLSPEALLDRKKETWEMSYNELREYIEDMKDEGYEVPWLKAELYHRIGLALTPLLLVFLVFPFGVRSPREGSWGGIIGAMCALVAYWGAITFFLQLGKKGAFPPFLAIFIPHILCLTLAIWGIKRVEG